METSNNPVLDGIIKELKDYALIGAKEALTTEEAALYAGISKSHLYKLVCYKKIPYYKSAGGKLTFFRKSELENWLLHTRVKTNEEVQADAINYVVTGKKGFC
jgi:excisionase family DNA binding protein